MGLVMVQGYFCDSIGKKIIYQALHFFTLAFPRKGVGAFAAIPGRPAGQHKNACFFIGHGNPQNAFRDNPFTRSLTQMGQAVNPSAILVISAHWLSLGDTFISTRPKYENTEYKVVGAPSVADLVMEQNTGIVSDSYRQLDHGAWAILRHIKPKADIPVLELSIDMEKPLDYHWRLSQQLRSLRDRGVLIIGSGNIVHNLELSALKFFSSKPYGWAIEFDEWVKGRIDDRDFSSLFYYFKLGTIADRAVPTMDHYLPMLYSLALADANEPITYTYEEVFSGISMRCFRIG